MTKKKAMPSPPTTKPRPNDVLLGRGSGPSQYTGNKQFRRLAGERHDEYTATVKHKDKKRIAKALLDRIHSLGGRFLCLDGRMVGCSIVEDGTWCIAPQDVALEKCKQSLREKRETTAPRTKKTKKRPAKEAEDEENTESEVSRSSENREKVTERSKPRARSFALGDGRAEVMPSSSFSDGTAHRRTPMNPPDFSSVLPSWSLAGQPTVDARLQLYQPSPDARQTSQFNHASQRRAEDTYSHASSKLPPGMLHCTDPTIAASRQQGVADHMRSYLQEPLRQQQAQLVRDGLHDLDNSLDCNVNSDMTPLPKETVAQEDVSEYLLSSLSLTGRETLSEEQEKMEQATLKDQEKVAALLDMFGQMCTIDAPQGKRARRDLDAESIVFLVKQMRLELESIPKDKKQALLEAQVKSHPEEFSDERLVKFLRCEGMNTEVRL